MLYDLDGTVGKLSQALNASKNLQSSITFTSSRKIPLRHDL